MNTRYDCPSPSCEDKHKTFTRYIDIATGQPLHPSVGKCNRANKCGYHYTPRQFFQDNPDQSNTDTTSSYRFRVDKKRSPFPVSAPLRHTKQETLIKPISFIPVDIFEASLKGSPTNYFKTFLTNRFGWEIANAVISRYFIGTSKKWEGATIFWQIDANGKIRTGKIMLYDPGNCKRVKEPCNRIGWAHSELNQEHYELQQCLFGEHLLKDKTKHVALVESEKTAIISSIYFPQYIWLATGGLNNLNAEKCKVLKGRYVVLFPDLKGFDKWDAKREELSQPSNFSISDLLETRATPSEKEQGLDLADYLLRYDPDEFPKTETTRISTSSSENKQSPQADKIQTEPSTSPKQLIAYTDSQGRLYIPTPFSTTYTIYPSIAHYNQRSSIRRFEPKEGISSDSRVENFNSVFINTDTLTITDFR